MGVGERVVPPTAGRRMALRRTAGRGQDSGHISYENPTAVTIDSGRGDEKQINLIISTLAYVILGIVQPNPSDL